MPDSWTLGLHCGILRKSSLRALVGVTFFIFSAISGIADENDQRPIRFLVIYEQDSTLPVNREMADGLELGIAATAQAETEIYSEFLDLARFSGQVQKDAFAQAIKAKYADHAPDVLLAVGPGSFAFVLGHRDEIGPDKPVIFLAMRTPEVMPAHVGGVESKYDILPTLALARQLQPDATRINVVAGSANFDKRWSDTAHTLFGDTYEGLPVRYIEDLTLDATIAEVRALGPDEIVLYLTMFQDSAGQAMVPRVAAERISEASGAPVYSVYESYVGSGILGGRVYGFVEIGEAAGKLAGEVANGAVTLPAVVETLPVTVIDWRQLDRYGLKERNLPEDTELRNFEPGPWRKYRFEILAVGGLLLLQSITIAALLNQDRRRRRASEAETQMRKELTHLSRVAQLGELSGALAHELNQPLTSIMANAAAGSRILKSEKPDLALLAEILKDITDSDTRASTIIHQLRALIMNSEAGLAPIDLNSVVDMTMPLLNSELITRHIRLKTGLSSSGLPVMGNPPQLQQVLINLVSNAMEAMQETPVEHRKLVIRTRPLPDGYCELSVADFGPGVNGESQQNIFRPFVSGKTQGLGLGLSICTTIANAHNGKLELDPTWAHGARFLLILPTHA